MWLRIRQHGKRIPLEAPEDVADYLPLLLTGAGRKDAAGSIAAKYATKGEAYNAWAVEAGGSLADIAGITERVVALSYERLRDYRARLDERGAPHRRDAGSPRATAIEPRS